MSFLEYLKEAQFSEQTINKVIKILEKKLTLKLGKLYRYNGPDGIEELVNKDGKNFECYLYFLSNGRAFRINTWRYRIMSIEIWKRYGSHTNSDFYVDVSELNSVSLLAIIDELAEKIKMPAVGEIDLYFLPESTQKDSNSLLTEARRSNPVEFYNLCKNKLGNMNLERLDWSDINTVAAENDVQVPSYIRGQRKDGFYSVVPPGLDTNTGAVTNPDAVSVAAKKGNEPIKSLMITVTPIGMDNKFKSVSDSKEAQDALGKIQTALQSTPPAKEIKNVNTLFGRMAQLVEIVCQGSLKALLIYGGPGIGKCLQGDENINIFTINKNGEYINVTKEQKE